MHQSHVESSTQHGDSDMSCVHTRLPHLRLRTLLTIHTHIAETVLLLAGSVTHADLLETNFSATVNATAVQKAAKLLKKSLQHVSPAPLSYTILVSVLQYI